MGDSVPLWPPEAAEACCHPAPFQFPDIVEFSETMANAGKTVIVAALDGTFQRKVRGLSWALGRDREGGGEGWGRNRASSLSTVLPG